MALLLQSGAQVNAVNSSQCSALHIAINKQHVRCVQVLLRHGCDINVQVNLSCYIYRHDAIWRVTNAGVVGTTAPVLLADCVTTGNGLKNGIHCGL